MNLQQSIQIQSRRYIKANEPLLLNDSQTIWTVQSGAIAVFATPILQGHPEGQRRYLFTVSPGEALFSVPVCLESTCWGLVAVPLEPTELSAILLSGANCPDTELQTLKSLIDGWIHKLGSIKGLPQPEVPGQVPETHYVSLLKGQICQPHDQQVLWIRMQQGTALWMGDLEFPLTSEMGCFPIDHRMLLQAKDHIEFFARRTAEVKSREVLTKGLAQLHQYILRAVEQIAAQDTKAAFERFQARQQLNQQVTQQTIRNLTALLRPQPEDGLPTDSALLMAAGAVGKAMGVQIHPPLQSENLQRVKEPIEAIARASQLRSRRVLLRGNWWQRDGGPILAYTLMDRHPVALLPVSGNRYKLFDPIRAGLTDAEEAEALSQPSQIPVDAAVAQSLDPAAFIFYRPLPEGNLQAWDLLKFALYGRQRDVLAILLTGVAATGVGMLVPQATAVLIDQAIPYGQTGLMIQIGIGLLAAAFGSAAFQLAQAIASMRIETASDATLQAAVWDRLLRLKTAFFRQYSIGDLNARVSGISSIRRKLSGTVLQSIFTSFFALLNFGLLVYYSPPLAALALAVALVVVVFTTVSGALIIQKQRPLKKLEGEIYGLLVQLINGVPKLRIAGAEERAFARWGQKYAQQLRLRLSTQRLEDGVNTFNAIAPTLTSIALFWLASTMVNVSPQSMSLNGLSTGTFLAFLAAYGIFISGATSLSLTLTEVLDVIPLWQRSQPILAAEPEVNQDRVDPGPLAGGIRMDHISFRYREDGPLILDNVTLEAQPGEFIALVGPSGSGKSTIFRMLLGFDTPHSGTIYYDGQDLAGLDVSAVRRQLGVVLQNGRINAGSIFENIAGGALISLDEAWAAAEMSGLADDIRAMPMQMHTVISEGGTNLSGGQRQRLVIARALALQPQILLLDEATSALDNRTQAIVSQSLDRLNVTRIAIAHRLSTIRNADRIYVLESGRLIQQGRFEELADQPGLFAQLMRRQAI